MGEPWVKTNMNHDKICPDGSTFEENLRSNRKRSHCLPRQVGWIKVLPLNLKTRKTGSYYRE